MTEPTKVDKNPAAVVWINSHCTEKVVGHVQHCTCIIVSWFYPCPIALWTSLQIRNMEVNRDWKSLWIFIFIDLFQLIYFSSSKIRNFIAANKTYRHSKHCLIIHLSAIFCCFMKDLNPQVHWKKIISFYFIYLEAFVTQQNS